MIISHRKKNLSKLSKLFYLFLLFSCLSVFACSTENPDIHVGFSPEGSGQTLILNIIKSAKYNIRMMSYSFTDPDIMKALVQAHKHGVDIKIVIDEKGNHTKASIAAMNFIVNSGIPLRTNKKFPIQHDKILIIDNHIIETGSYNFTRSAARRNSENVMIIQCAPKNIVEQYLNHWQSRWDMGTDWHSLY